jgi:PAS domain S-box-containing protein
MNKSRKSDSVGFGDEVDELIRQHMGEVPADLREDARQLVCDLVVRQQRLERENAALLRQSRENRSTLQSVIEQCPTGLVIAEAPSGRIVAFNAQAEEILGHPMLTTEDYHGFEQYGALHSDGTRYQADEHPLARALVHGEVVDQEEVLYRRGDGRIVTLSANAAPIHGENGSVSAAVVTFSDITKRKQAEEELAALNETLEERVVERSAELNRTNALLRAALEEVRLLEGIVNRSPAVVFRWRVADGWPVETVSENVKQFGYTVDDFLSGRVSWPAMTHPGDVPRLEAEVARYLSTREDEFTQEYRIIAKSGDVRWCEDHNRVIRDSDDVITHIEGVVMDVTEKKQIEMARQESEQRFQQLFALVPDALMVFDADSLQFVDVNPAAMELYGYSREEFLSLKQSAISAEPEESLRSINEIIAGSVERIPLRWHRKKDGTVFPVEISGGTIQWEGRKALFGAVRDIAKRQQAEVSLRESEAKFRTLAEQSPNMIFINHRGRVVYANPKCEELMGYTRDEFYAPDFDFRCLIASEYQDVIEARYQQHLQGEETDSVEYSLITKDGQRIDSMMTTTLMDYQGEKAILGIVTDIRALKNTEGELRCQRAELQTILDHCPAYIFRKDNNGVTAFVNRALAEMAGRPADEWKGKTVFDLYSSELAEQYDRDDRKVVTSGRPKTGIVEPIESPSGMRWLETDKIPLRDKQGAVTGLIGFSVDITERKQATDELRESEKRFRSVFDHAPMGVAIADWEGRLQQCNPAYCDLLGYTEEELHQMEFASLVHPDDRDANLAKLHRLKAGEWPFFEIENRYVHKDGRSVWVHKLVSTLPDITGKPAYQMALVTNITERRKTAEALQESEQRYRAIVDNAVDGILLADPLSKKLVACNQRICEMLGYTRGEIEQLTVRDIHPKESLPYVLEQFEKQVSGEITLANDLPVKKKDGSVFYADINAFPLTLVGKKYMTGLFRDMTERRQLETKVRQSEGKYRMLAERTSDIPYAMDYHGVVTYVGPQVARYGIAPDDIVGGDVFKHILPKDRGRVAAELQRHLATGEEFPVELRIKGGDGRVYWFEAQGRTQFDPDGNPGMNTGVLREITERKRLEGALAELSTQERQRFGRDMHDGLGQELTGLGFLATALCKGLEARGDPYADSARELTEGLQLAVDSTRRIARGLVPVEVEAGGLVGALQQLVAGAEAQFGTACRFHCPQDVLVDNVTVATELFHIAQEAISNAVRHGRSKHIDVELMREGDAVSLTVCDDGEGLPADRNHPAGMGLRIMRYRAGKIGATFEVGFVDGRGTKIACTIAGGGG